MKTSTFALVFGIAFLALGLMGLVPAMLVSPPIDVPPTSFTLFYGYLLGLFPVNLVASLVHLAVGAWGISAWSGRSSRVGFARGVAILFGVLAVMGLVPVLNTTLGMIPLQGNDVWLHGITALVAAYFGWRQPAEMSERRYEITDRRQSLRPVARERRLGLNDRREGFDGMSPA